MIVKKEGWRLINSLFILLVLSCNDNKIETNNRQFECLLDVFMEHPPTMGEDYIYVSESQNWSDSTSVISFQYSDIPPIDLADSVSSKISEFKGFKIIYTLNSFNKIVQENHLISTDLKWKKINPNNYQPVSEDKYLKFSEYELQFIYDFKNEKVIDVLKAYPVNKSKILKKVQKCNN